MPLSAGHGVIVRAANGDVIRYDPSGLVMRLSDKVIADIAQRLGAGVAAPGVAEAAAAPASATQTADPQELLEGIDAWDLRIEGEWLIFTARLAGRQGVRAFRRHRDGGDIIADAPGPLLGILGIGGPRAALATDAKSQFPHHVVAPADDIGAVGHAGVERAGTTNRLECLREMTHEALVAETLLSWQMDKFEPMPLFVTRVETDSSASSADLGQGQAFDNLIVCASNLALAAANLGKKPRILAICLDFALEDRSGSALAYRDGMLALMTRAEAGLGTQGFQKPLFAARFECGSSEITTAEAIEGQWELAWNHGDHRLIFSAPGYMFEHDEFDRPTDAARRQMAEMTAAATSIGDDWRCPVLHLAEREAGDEGRTIRIVAQAMGDLVIDGDDPLGAGGTAGFRLLGATNGAVVKSARIAPDDSKAILLRCDKRPEGDALRVAYAYGADPRPGVYPANCGAVRDDWHLQSATDRRLHRWALPAVLPVTPGTGYA